jgi:hypothetical protein
MMAKNPRGQNVVSGVVPTTTTKPPDPPSMGADFEAKAPVAPRLITEWSTHDEALARTLRLIAEFPEYSLERMELEAQLHLWQAAELLRDVGRMRAERARRRN